MEGQNVSQATQAGVFVEIRFAMANNISAKTPPKVNLVMKSVSFSGSGL